MLTSLVLDASLTIRLVLPGPHRDDGLPCGEGLGKSPVSVHRRSPRSPAGKTESGRDGQHRESGGQQLPAPAVPIIAGIGTQGHRVSPSLVAGFITDEP